jgi:hypothetical protein
MMFAALFAFSIYLQLPLLIVVISLVYSATRHDDWPSIFQEAFRWGSRMALFLAAIAANIYLLVVLPVTGFLVVLGIEAVGFFLYMTWHSRKA